ncbi:MAG: hypothetical protein ACRD34_10620 [Bryobacteraceae bacterium]
MAKSNNSFSSLFRKKPLTNLMGSNTGGAGIAESSERAPSQNGLRALSIGSKDALTGIQFGSPSSPGSTSTAGSGSWINLLQHTASQSLASAAKGSFSLADLGGIGSVLSGISKLFDSGGGAETLPPLVKFGLPNPVAETVSLNSSGSRTEARSTAQTSSAPLTAAPSNQSAQIVQAVKHALLTSSSLNDVIAEI